jgi:hypothetical protein
MTTYLRVRSARRLAAAAAAACAFPAAAGASPAPPVRVTVDAGGIHAPVQLRPGLTTFQVTSDTAGVSSLQVARLNRGVSYRQVAHDARTGLAAVFPDVTGKGGLSHIGLSAGRRWTTRLSPGRYLFVDDESNLFAPFVVRGPARHFHAPHDTGTVFYRPGGIELPKRFGDGTWRFVNRDKIAHAVGLVRISGKHSRAQALRAAATDHKLPWLTAAGTLNALGRGQQAWFTLHGLHGRYLLLDYLPMAQGAAPGPLVVFHRFR